MQLLARSVRSKKVREIRSDYLTNYLAARKIPLELARKYLKEIIVYNSQKGLNFTLVGIPNISTTVLLA
jgi:hypothetical protein